ncbi:MAG: threonine/serine dehydratase [Rhodospirillales bacterium]|nr:threonine/serine dehydratase [Rhodospirillales bacterium]
MSSVTETFIPTLKNIQDAARLLEGLAVRTPLLESPQLNDLTGGRILVKAEMLQRTGSFKFRGAYNKMSRISETDKAKGVVAYSSGNHAQAVAASAKLLGMSAVIIMPKDAPEIKINNTRGYGAEVILYDRMKDSREAIGEKIALERGATLIKPYDDPLIISGQGTLGLEMAGQARDMNARLDAVLIPCSGGGLSSGCATAFNAVSPETNIYSVEPEGYDDMAQSLSSGRKVAVDGKAKSICDALLTPTPGDITFAIASKLLAGGLVVSDKDAANAMTTAFSMLKVVVEPGGSVGLAAVLSGAYDARGKTVGIICSGGNVDAKTFTAALR